VRLKDCDRWENETLALEEIFKEAGTPSVSLERQILMGAAGQLSLRVEAFREMVESKKDI